MPNDPARVRAAFLAAVEEPDPNARAAILDRECSADDDLRRRVEALLRAHDQPDSLLDPLAVAVDKVTAAGSGEVPEALCATLVFEEPAEARPLVEGPGTVIGPYKLLQKIGEGGMGAVFMAEQERPVRRKVALKVIKPGMDTETVVARFEAERQALALMDHPNIARVLDAGATESGRPYFVMELVHGAPITRYCDDARLSPKERLELFASVCSAIQHAHQKGIIHRDIKPSNVLVTMIDGRPVPKVIDFGVAKAMEQPLTERSLFTQFGAIVGTLEYMAPEQAELSGTDVDTRADIYALGVLLYELLTGTTPLERARLREAGYSEILRRIKEEEPPRPSTRLSDSGDRLASIAATRGVEPARLARLVRGDLDWIVMKALEKDRARRYETANGFARDVRRYLEGDPVEACPPSRAYRLRKFARKHRAALATASAFAMLLVAATAVSVALALWARHESRRVKQSLDRLAEANRATVKALEDAKASRAAARAEADKATAINDFLTKDLLSQAEPENNEFEDHVTLLEVLDRAAAKVGQRFGPRPEVEEAVRSTIAHAYHGLGAWRKAEAQFREVFDSARRRLGPNARPTLVAGASLAHILNHDGRAAEAILLHEAMLEALQARLGPDHPETLKIRSDLAAAYRETGRIAEAIRRYTAIQQVMETKLGPDHYLTLANRFGLAVAYRAAGRIAEAIRLHEVNLAALESRLGPDHTETLKARDALARAYQEAGRTAEAIRLYEATLKVEESKLGPDHPYTLNTRHSLADAYRAAGRTVEAIRLYEATLKARELTLGPDHPETLTTRHNLAGVYHVVGRDAEASATYEDVARRRTATLGPDHPDTLSSLHALGHTLELLGRPADAIPAFRRAGEGYRRLQGPNGALTLDLTRDLARALSAAGRSARDGDAGELMLREGLSLARKDLPPDSPELANILAQLGMNLLNRSKWADAEPFLHECLAIRARAIPDHWSRFNAMSCLGGALAGQGRYAEAEPLIVEGYEGMQARAATIPPQAEARLSEAAARLVTLYETWGRPAEARRWRGRLGLATLPAEVFARRP